MKATNAITVVAVVLGLMHYGMTVYVEYNRIDRASIPSAAENHTFTAAPAYDENGNRKLNHGEGWQ